MNKPKFTLGVKKDIPNAKRFVRYKTAEALSFSGAPTDFLNVSVGKLQNEEASVSFSVRNGYHEIHLRMPLSTFEEAVKFVQSSTLIK